MKKATTPQFFEVGYSYASSSNACKFGFDKTGCYCVSIIKGDKPGKAIAGFATKDEAEAHAATLGIPRKEWSFEYTGA